LISKQTSIPKIQRVPKFLREEGKKIFYKYYTPKIITFGPIHHNSECLKEIIKKKRKSECLKEGEQYKHFGHQELL
jgi:hypothetical protein